MQMKILFGAAVFFGGWLWFYLFIRQFLFNILTAYPLIKRLEIASPDLIGVGARRYTMVSNIVCLLLAAIIAALVLRFCPLYLQLSFLVGVLLALVLHIGKLSPDNRNMFDVFCSEYYRFIPDDELRTAVFNKNSKQIKQRLHNMGYPHDFVPTFTVEKK